MLTVRGNQPPGRVTPDVLRLTIPEPVIETDPLRRLIHERDFPSRGPRVSQRGQARLDAKRRARRNIGAQRQGASARD